MERSKLGLLGTLALVAVLAATPARAQNDADLFSTAVAPNVLLVMDNSSSMNEVVWHPSFDPSAPTTCNYWTSNQTWTSNRTETRCGTTRTYYVDPEVTAAGNSMRFYDRYLNWLHSLPNGDPRLAEIAATANGTYSACLQAQGYTTYSKYRRARITAAKDVLREVICNVNQVGDVRFGLGQFRLPGSSEDPNGGYVRVPINDYGAPAYALNGTTASHGAHLDTAIDALEGVTWTPLGETLFQMYTYFMSRTTSSRPYGVNGSTRFPAYVYRTSNTGNFGPYTTTASQVPPSPVQYKCQKNFVILVTDGEATKDDFDASNSTDQTSAGFTSFGSLIGNYNNDGETEIAGTACFGTNYTSSDECALYLDDIAKFMHERDFQPVDLDGKQTVEIYTIGFSTSPAANDLLTRAAAAGGGQFYTSNNPEQLADAIVSAVTDIVRKSQSFTAATVPATRTADGGNIYTSLFLPTNDAYWEGHLKLFNFTSEGDILDANDACAFDNPLPPGECKSGQISLDAVPFWDAGEEIPDPDLRTLYTSLPGSGRVGFDTSLTYQALGSVSNAADDLVLGDLSRFPGSGATTVEGLADALIENVRGCELGTGVTNTCVRRRWILGDIFHSNPLIVGRPRSFINETSYRAFAASLATRDVTIYAGSNDGWLHGFHAGDWNAAAVPPAYDRGTGEELFGFMPWPVRQRIDDIADQEGNRTVYGVDGSPAAADVWFYGSPTQVTKAADGSEWRTILMAGLRQGGRAYYALDVTDPSAAGYPEYQWEFPAENAPAAEHAYMGETWGQPVITKVRVDIGGQPYERWVAIVTGGYDPRSDPNVPLSYNASATAGRAIYIVDLKTGGILGEKEYTPSATDGRQQMLYAMASTPSVFDIDQDGYADVIYVGDLGGNVWKWVIKYDPFHGNFLVDPINSSGSTTQPGTKFRRWFAAQATAAASLGVTIAPQTYYKSIFFSPAGAFALDSFWLAFGTGERANLLRTHNTTTTAENNRFYSVKDEDPLDRRTTPIPLLTEADLADQTASATCPSLSAKAGYFFRVADGEKFTTDSDIFGYWVIASTFMPPAAADPCNANGEANLYVFKLYCGEGFFFDSASLGAGGGGLPGGGPGGSGGLSDPSLPDYGDPASRRIALGAGMPTDPRVTVSPSGTRIIVNQQGGEVENEEGPPGGGAAPGQLYWRELAQ